MKVIKQLFKYVVLFLIGGATYFCIEMLWRGHSHWTMFIVGGICFIFCGGINEWFDWDMPLWKQMLICSVGITAIEFLAGIAINLIFKLNVWDYSNQPFNILGQICLLYSFLWFLLSLLAIITDDYLRYWLFDEEKPHYNLFGGGNR